MAYEKGEVQIATEDDCDVKLGDAYLPHSCDEWVIGGETEIRELITDLLGVLFKLELEKNK